MGSDTGGTRNGGVFVRKKLLIMSQSKFFRDPRVLKESVIASENGFDVTSLCYYGDFDSDVTDYKGVKIHRILNCGRKDEFLDRLIKYLYDKFVWFPTNLKMVRYKYQVFKQNNYMRYYRLKARTRMNLFLGDKQKELKVDSIGMPSKLYILVCDLFYLYFISNFDIYRYARKFNVDIYHSTDLITLLAGFALKKMHPGTKLVYDSHELWIDSQINYPPKLKLLLHYYEQFLIRRVDAVVTVNESIASELVKRYKIKQPIVVLNCPMYEESKNNRVNDGYINVIYQGVYVVERGLEELIQSFAFLDDKYRLYLRGYESVLGYEDSLKKIVSDNGLESRVTFLEPVSMVDMVKSIDNYDIGVVPYIPTNLNQLYASPNKTFEYMMGGLAIVVSDIPELNRFVVNNGVGLNFNPGDISDIARAIKEIGDNRDAMSKMKENALKFSKNEYNWGVQGDKIVEKYKELVC